MKRFLSSLILGTLVFSIFATGMMTKEGVKEAKADTLYTLQVDTFTSSGVWTAPTGVTSVNVEAWGAGGGGTSGVGGGGGGGYASSTVFVTPGNAYYVVVGTSAVNTDGGYSTFATTTVIAAGGLSGTNGGYGAPLASSTGDTVHAGGNGVRGATGTKNGGGGAGDTTNGSGATAGTVNGGGDYSPFAGGGYGGGVVAQGAIGHVRITYSIAATSGFPAVQNRSWGRDASSGTSHVITLPNGISSGELLLVFVFSNDDDDGGSDYSIGADWTRLIIGAYSGFDLGAIYYKVAAGSDTATVTTTDSKSLGWICFRILNGGTPVGATANGSTGAANPPNLDTGLSAKYLWLALGAYGSLYTIVTPPASYSSSFGQTNIAGGNVIGHSSERFLEAQATNPGTFKSSGGWAAFTIAIPYSSSGSPPTPPSTVQSSPGKGWGNGVSAGGVLNW